MIGCFVLEDIYFHFPVSEFTHSTSEVMTSFFKKGGKLPHIFDETNITSKFGEANFFLAPIVINRGSSKLPIFRGSNLNVW